MSGGMQALTHVALRAIAMRPWANGAYVGDVEWCPYAEDLTVYIHNGKLGRAMRSAIVRVPRDMLDLSGWRAPGEVVDRLDAFVGAELDLALVRCGFSPFKRTTRWRIDRNGRRQWQIGQEMKAPRS